MVTTQADITKASRLIRQQPNTYPLGVLLETVLRLGHFLLTSAPYRRRLQKEDSYSDTLEVITALKTIIEREKNTPRKTHGEVYDTMGQVIKIIEKFDDSFFASRFLQIVKKSCISIRESTEFADKWKKKNLANLESLTTTKYRGHLVFIGDSHMLGEGTDSIDKGLAQQIAKVRDENYYRSTNLEEQIQQANDGSNTELGFCTAKSGSTTERVLTDQMPVAEALCDLFPDSEENTVVYMGLDGNDLQQSQWQGEDSLEEYASQLIQRLEDLPVKKIIVQTCLKNAIPAPPTITLHNAFLEASQKEGSKITYTGMGRLPKKSKMTDAFHPTAAGYKKMAKDIVDSADVGGIIQQPLFKIRLPRITDVAVFSNLADAIQNKKITEVAKDYAEAVRK